MHTRCAGDWAAEVRCRLHAGGWVCLRGDSDARADKHGGIVLEDVLRGRPVRRVDAKEGLAAWLEVLAQRDLAGGGVAGGELDLASVVRVEELEEAADLVGPRVRRGHHTDVDL